ncbi:hypothetical protein GCM10014719_21600 [Planomonospora parontospora subsp. antibiotica]|nr:hypothetical protein GCM10014719_21600 [Planomonospora parontospora subsp. antibiotica]GII15464.1 hypothetical protein Ppa05_21900 [Planomonospora parontospora subsp. antibiotica]
MQKTIKIHGVSKAGDEVPNDRRTAGDGCVRFGGAAGAAASRDRPPGPHARLAGKRRAARGGAERCRLEPVKKL